jgi:hypothetical protein
MSSIEVARPYKGLMREIFLNYLLPKYKTIESDTIQTVNAFLFYKKLAIESIVNKNFSMYIKYDKIKVDLHPTQLDVISRMINDLKI